MTQHRRRWRTTASVQRRAKELRRNHTPAEAQLWRCLRGRGLDGHKFRRQHPIGPFIVDFCCPARRLVIELDGDSHAAQEDYDRSRTEWLEAKGYRVVRFTNREVQHQCEAVLEAIAELCV